MIEQVRGWILASGAQSTSPQVPLIYCLLAIGLLAAGVAALGQMVP